MIYRDFAGEKISILGFGAMRFPTEKDGKVVEEEAISMLRTAMDKGVNYIDTAFGYHEGQSETIVGKALKDGYRDKAFVATKSPMWHIKEAADFDKILDTQLSRLDIDCIDFYMFHALGAKSWQKCKDLDLLSLAEKAKKDGKIKRIGFSFHDKYPALETILNEYDKWEFCMIQLHYIDTVGQAGIRGVEKIAEKGVPVVIMEPLWGGKLANPPKAVQKIFDESGVERSPVEWALDWLWAKPMPQDLILISGMSNMQQVLDNIEYATRALETINQEVITKAQEVFGGLRLIPCTGCSYCGCPQGVSIVNNFEAYNTAHIDDRIEDAKGHYNGMTMWSGPNSQAKNCTACGACEELCPQYIKISEEMPKVARYFS
jgi:hypothetical protein